MMRQFRSALLVLPILATGCVSVEEQAAVDRSTCSRYGFAEGSVAFADCVMRTAHRREDANRDYMDRLRKNANEKEWQKIARERNQMMP